jgi:nicotinamidase-related amidase
LFDLPKNRHLIERNHDDGFLHTFKDECSGLEPLLERLGIKGAIFAGINAHSCVYFTASSAHFRGYSVITGEDIIANYVYDLYTKRDYYEKGDFPSTYFDNCKQLLRSMEVSVK